MRLGFQLNITAYISGDLATRTALGTRAMRSTSLANAPGKHETTATDLPWKHETPATDPPGNIKLQSPGKHETAGTGPPWKYETPATGPPGKHETAVSWPLETHKSESRLGNVRSGCSLERKQTSPRASVHIWQRRTSWILINPQGTRNTKATGLGHSRDYRETLPRLPRDTFNYAPE